MQPGVVRFFFFWDFPWQCVPLRIDKPKKMDLLLRNAASHRYKLNKSKRYTCRRSIELVNFVEYFWYGSNMCKWCVPKRSAVQFDFFALRSASIQPRSGLLSEPGQTHTNSDNLGEHLVIAANYIRLQLPKIRSQIFHVLAHHRTNRCTIVPSHLLLLRWSLPQRPASASCLNLLPQPPASASCLSLLPQSRASASCL